jgi:hypothetical protein
LLGEVLLKETGMSVWWWQDGVAPPRVRHRALTVLLAAGLDAGAALLLVSRQLPAAVLGVALAGLGWLVTSRLTRWYRGEWADDAEES